MPKKRAFILLLPLGALCLYGGSKNSDTKEILVGVAILLYSIVSLVLERKKRKEIKPKVEKKGAPPVS